VDEDAIRDVASVEVTGDTATANLLPAPDGPQLRRMCRVAGAWLLDFAG
jgi:hypothetical protein